MKIISLEDHFTSAMLVENTPSPATEFLRALPISEQDKEKVAHLNAERLLRL